MLHYDPMNIPIRQQRQKFGALIVDAAAAFFDDFANRPALRMTPRDEPLGLRVEILVVLSRRHTGVDRDELRSQCAHLCLVGRLLDDHGASGQLIARNLASFIQPVGRIVMDSQFFGVTRQLHNLSIR
jgi:hypothetical protein